MQRKRSWAFQKTSIFVVLCLVFKKFCIFAVSFGGWYKAEYAAGKDSEKPLNKKTWCQGVHFLRFWVWRG
jgi:hypothetical protein